MRRRDLLMRGLAAFSAGGLAPRAAFAQTNYPDRPIRLIIPFPPGGGFDAVGRPWAEKVKPLLGTIVVENQGGGGEFDRRRDGRARSAGWLHDPAWRIEHPHHRGDP
jgi:hypothetical protein